MKYSVFDWIVTALSWIVIIVLTAFCVQLLNHVEVYRDENVRLANELNEARDN